MPCLGGRASKAGQTGGPTGEVAWRPTRGTTQASHWHGKRPNRCGDREQHNRAAGRGANSPWH
eukprot:11214633-Alexandrium_andersonii.AAC.1